MKQQIGCVTAATYSLVVIVVLATAGFILRWFNLAGAVAFAVAIFSAFAFGLVIGMISEHSLLESKLKNFDKQAEHLRKTTKFEVHVTTDKGEQWGAFIQSVPGEKVYNALRRSAMDGRSFTVRDMSGVLSRNEFESLRSELIERGLMCWKNQDCPNQGVEWTRGGHALLNTIKGTSPLPDRTCAGMRLTQEHTHAHTHTPAHVVSCAGTS